MQPTFEQPHASPISDELIAEILRHDDSSRQIGELEIDRLQHFSNDIAVVKVPGGRRMMVKRGRHPWSAERFAIARRASRLLRTGAGIIAPDPIDLPAGLSEEPLEAYWRIELPLFADLWSELDDPQRRAAMRSLGSLLRRAHAAAPDGRRLLSGAGEPFSREFLQRDLTHRLLPAITHTWPAGLALLERLMGAAPAVLPEAPPLVPLHGDLHLGNVLCRMEGQEVRCVGLIDLEWAHFGPLESDLGRFQVMHSGPFEMPLEPEAISWLHEGLGQEVDERLLTFFSLYHYVNLGFYSAVIGHHRHAQMVAEAASQTAEVLHGFPK